MNIKIPKGEHVRLSNSIVVDEGGELMKIVIVVLMD